MAHEWQMCQLQTILIEAAKPAPGLNTAIKAADANAASDRTPRHAGQSNAQQLSASHGTTASPATAASSRIRSPRLRSVEDIEGHRHAEGLRLRALLVWLFLNWVQLVWNRDFDLFRWWTWAAYRHNHPDKLAVSLLSFGVITYFAIESLRHGGVMRTPDFDKVFRAGFLVLAVIFLWMFWNYNRRFSVSVDGPIEVEATADLSPDPIKVELSPDPINIEIQR